MRPLMLVRRQQKAGLAFVRACFALHTSAAHNLNAAIVQAMHQESRALAQAAS